MKSLKSGSRLITVILVVAAIVFSVFFLLLYFENLRTELIEQIENMNTSRLESEVSALQDSLLEIKETLEEIKPLDSSIRFDLIESMISNISESLDLLLSDQRYSSLEESILAVRKDIEELQLSFAGLELPVSVDCSASTEKLTDGLISIVDSLKELRESLSEEFSSLKEGIDLIEIRAASTDISLDATEGGGVRIRIESGFKGSSILHDSDILMILNELYALNTRELSINGKRILPYTYIRCVGATVIINGEPTRISPVVIDVLGEYDYIVSGLGLLSEYFKGREIDMTFLPLEFISIPAGGG